MSNFKRFFGKEQMRNKVKVCLEVDDLIARWGVKTFGGYYASSAEIVCWFYDAVSKIEYADECPPMVFVSYKEEWEITFDKVDEKKDKDGISYVIYRYNSMVS